MDDRINDGNNDSVPGEFGTLSDADFERVRKLIYGYAGIALNPSKRTMVASRLARRLRALGKRSYPEYLSALEATSRGTGEWQEFVNALTTNLTSFFREAHHFPILAEHLRRLSGAPKIWCCAASTGEEPYTIAMTVKDALRNGASGASILATDIDTNVLTTARRGVYPMDVVSKLERGILTRHFDRGRGANQGLTRVKQDLRSMIRFEQLNLLDQKWKVDSGFDVIFCRNVMIYFDKETQFRILRRLGSHMKPGGLLFVGHSENFTQARDEFVLEGKTVYRFLGSSDRRKAA